MATLNQTMKAMEANQTKTGKALDDLNTRIDPISTKLMTIQLAEAQVEHVHAVSRKYFDSNMIDISLTPLALDKRLSVVPTWDRIDSNEIASYPKVILNLNTLFKQLNLPLKAVLKKRRSRHQLGL